MSEIDYTIYYVNKKSTMEEKVGSSEKGKIKRKKEEKSGKIKIDRCGENPKEKRAKIRKGNLVLIVLIMLCFLLTFAFAGLYSTGSVLGVFGSGNNSGYYAVYKTIGKDYSQAEAHSLVVRSGGGGGNIVKNKDDYIVIYAVYLDKGQADNVASREDGLEVTDLSIKELDVEHEEYARLYRELKVSALDGLYAAAIAYAQTSNDQELDQTVRAIAVECEELKSIIDRDDSLENSEKLSIIVAIDTIAGKVESITYAESGAETMANVWYQMYAIVG